MKWRIQIYKRPESYRLNIFTVFPNTVCGEKVLGAVEMETTEIGCSTTVDYYKEHPKKPLVLKPPQFAYPEHTEGSIFKL